MSELLVIHDRTPRVPAMNMALDEALLRLAMSRPVLRFYRWSKPSFSFGYFGRFSEARKLAGEHALVRRWTGGGIVPHLDDLTYALGIGSNNSAFRLSGREIYHHVHVAIATCLEQTGIKASLLAKDFAKVSDVCFANPVLADVMVDKRKIAGAAQRRTRSALLQQGSVQFPDLGKGFRDCLAEALAANVSSGEFEQAILSEAEDLAAQKYGTEEWLHRR